MCGIVGMLTNTAASDKQLKLLANLLFLDQMRGEHATGVAKIDVATGVAETIKRAVSATEFLNDDDVVKFLKTDRKRLYIGHNRFATMGNRGDNGAHPFTYEHITMVHNGTVDRWALNGLTGHGRKDVTVDSEMVCHTIADLGIKEAVKKFSGAFSLVWWDSRDRTLNFLRNDKRPMFITHTNECMLWASEKPFIEVLVDRDKTMVYSVKPYQTEAHLHYCWKFSETGSLENKGRPTVTKLNIKDIPDPTPITQYGSRYNSLWDDYPVYGGNAVNRATNDIVYSKDGVHLGTQLAVDRINGVLFDMGTKLVAGDRLAFKVTGFESWSSEVGKADPRGNIIGSLEIKGHEPIEIKCYNQLKSTLVNQDGSMFEVVVGTIESARSTPMVCKGIKSVSEVIIVVNLCQSISDPKYQENNKFVKEVTRTPLRNFPLAVEGHTFETPQDFYDFTSCGCSSCGQTPTANDNRNKHMFVYGIGVTNTLNIEEAEYICGACIIEDEKVRKSNNS